MTEQTPSRRVGLRDDIAAAIEAADYSGSMRRGDLADSVMPVLYREWPWLRAEADAGGLTDPEVRAQLHAVIKALGASETENKQLRAANTRVRTLAGRIRQGVPWTANDDDIAAHILAALDGQAPAASCSPAVPETEPDNPAATEATERPTLRERHRAQWLALTDAERAARIAALDEDDEPGQPERTTPDNPPTSSDEADNLTGAWTPDPPIGCLTVTTEPDPFGYEERERTGRNAGLVLPTATEATDTWKEPTHPHPCTAAIEGRATPGGRPVQCTREARHPENHVGPKQGANGRVLWTDWSAGATPHEERP